MKKLKQIQSILASSKPELRRKYNVKELGISALIQEASRKRQVM